MDRTMTPSPTEAKSGSIPSNFKLTHYPGAFQVSFRSDCGDSPSGARFYVKWMSIRRGLVRRLNERDRSAMAPAARP
jgi:hypothetical protein